jgi:acyl-CoA thioester hydrolase
MKKYSIEMEVRDNELDAQGIVNNANYMIYLAHARHKHGEELGINHTEFANQGLNLVLTSCTIKFRQSLQANDKFLVSSEIINGELPFHWAHRQEIKRISDNKVILKAMFNVTCVNKNTDDEQKLHIPELISELM